MEWKLAIITHLLGWMLVFYGCQMIEKEPKCVDYEEEHYKIKFLEWVDEN